MRGEDFGSFPGAAAAAVAIAAKAVGAIVHIKPDEFLEVLNRVSEPLVVVAESGVFSKRFKYLMSYNGIVFYTKSPTELSVTKWVEWVRPESISVPM